MTLHNVVLVSGGIDSAVCLKIAEERADNVHPLFFRYGQQSQAMEERAAKEQTNEIGETLHLIDYEDVFKNFRAGLMEDKEYDLRRTTDGEHSIGFVPHRNLHFLTTAAAWAEKRIEGESINIYFGPQQGDEEDYPDCRPHFVSSATKALEHGTDKNNITIQTPLLRNKKQEVIRRGERNGVDWSSTISCYNPPGYGQGCGECPACIERRKAFEDAMIIDPVEYP